MTAYRVMWNDGQDNTHGSYRDFDAPDSEAAAFTAGALADPGAVLDGVTQLVPSGAPADPRQDGG